MALTNTLKAENWVGGVDLPNMYWRVSKIVTTRLDDKDDESDDLVKSILCRIHVLIYPQKPVYGTKYIHTEVVQVPEEELVACEGDNVFAKAYNYIKTQDEYAEAVDV